jgi:serine/threonine protein kinase
MPAQYQVRVHCRNRICDFYNGAGAMGTVYLADDKKLDRSVAIKVLPAQSVADAGAVARFRREAKALRSCPIKTSSRPTTSVLSTAPRKFVS